MNGTLFVVLTALGLGVAFGKWWEHDRAGGSGDLGEYVEALEAELEAERDWNAVLREQRGRLASLAAISSLTGRAL